MQKSCISRWKGRTDVGSRRLDTAGEGWWQAPEPDGRYTYIEFNLDDISDNSGLIRFQTVTPVALRHTASSPSVPSERFRAGVSFELFGAFLGPATWAPPLRSGL